MVGDDDSACAGVITTLAFGLCPWCARRLEDNCGHPLPVQGDLELHRIALPYPDYPRYPALSLNGRSNRWTVNADVQAVRADVARLCRSIRPGRHVIVHLAWSPRTRGDRDDENLCGLLKACCDGLARGPRRPTVRNPGVAIGLDLVPNDTRQYMTKLMPVVLPYGEEPGMWLTVGIVRDQEGGSQDLFTADHNPPCSALGE